MKLSLMKASKLLSEGVFTHDLKLPLSGGEIDRLAKMVIEWLYSHPSFKEDLNKISDWAQIEMRDALYPVLTFWAKDNPHYFRRIEYNQFLNDLIKQELGAQYESGPKGELRTLHLGKEKAPWRS